MFCQCSADYFGKVPNTNTCPVCIGMPGALPVPNRTAIEWAIKIGQALNCKINRHSKFDRKHYFYPDLPKAYQISQYDEPLAARGKFQISNFKFQTTKSIGITRVHLEEDTGKLTHSGEDSLVDFNRSSVPLVEIVTEPDFDNVEDIKTFLEELHTIIKYLDVSDANMEEGSMRIEPNISLRESSKSELPNYKVEVKNINSFNFAKKAIEYEIIRQTAILDKGETPTQETRGYNEDKKITYSQRSKEEAQDYRYFPEPDIPPIELTDNEIADIKATLPELPSEKRARYAKEFKLKDGDAQLLTRAIETADYFERVVSLVKGSEQAITNAIINKKIDTTLSPEEFTTKFIELSKPMEVDEDKLSSVITSIIQSNPKQVEQYKAGKIGLMGFFIGQVMKEMKGQADPHALQKLIGEKLS
jgi:aspartyl-tRNA(Asn)/glutamyl-tRNA(Gln) amidotransferase subunit B